MPGGTVVVKDDDDDWGLTGDDVDEKDTVGLQMILFLS